MYILHTDDEEVDIDALVHEHDTIVLNDVMVLPDEVVVVVDVEELEVSDAMVDADRL